MNERELLVDCLRRLNRTELAYLLTGSMASNYWGIPRTTHDLDFVIQAVPISTLPHLPSPRRRKRSIPFGDAGAILLRGCEVQKVKSREEGGEGPPLRCAWSSEPSLREKWTPKSSRLTVTWTSAKPKQSAPGAAATR